MRLKAACDGLVAVTWLAARSALQSARWPRSKIGPGTRLSARPLPLEVEVNNRNGTGCPVARGVALMGLLPPRSSATPCSPFAEESNLPDLRRWGCLVLPHRSIAILSQQLRSN